jgi:hypothetical protein
MREDGGVEVRNGYVGECGGCCEEDSVDEHKLI